MSTEERVEIAKAYFKQGYNCCQSVVMAFQDVCGVDKKTLLKLTVGLGGGVGRMREVCGCVSGMAVLSGFLTSSQTNQEGTSQIDQDGNPESKSENLQKDSSGFIHQQKTAAYIMMQKMAAEFKKETGSIVCRELLGLKQAAETGGSPDSGISPVPEHRTADYYKKRPCEQMVALAARIVSESLGDNC